MITRWREAFMVVRALMMRRMMVLIVIVVRFIFGVGRRVVVLVVWSPHTIRLKVVASPLITTMVVGRRRTVVIIASIATGATIVITSRLTPAAMTTMCLSVRVHGKGTPC
jgi:hypothetical protein